MHPQSARNVGIIALDIYFPLSYVNQSELETFDKVSKGKYTIGLGQQNMSFVNANEDINSICLTVLNNLCDKYNILPQKIGRLEIGTETLIDKSKSIKTTLMDFFANYNNHSIEGITTTNACYGATAALFNTIAWVESSAWDGRYGIVIAADIAVYAKGNARPTGGAGAVAMLIGPDAIFVLERERSTYMENAWDFYKPNLNSEYPTVDGKNSIDCYLNAIDKCYSELKNKKKQFCREQLNLNNIDFCCFHTPFGKMVYKSFLRLVYHDIKNNEFQSEFVDKIKLIKKNPFDTKDVQESLNKISAQQWNSKAKSGLLLSSELGNIYTGALYGCLISLISDSSINLENKRILMFSYGSGLASSMFILKVNQNTNFLRRQLNIKNRLTQRIKFSPEDYDKIMDLREKNLGKTPFKHDPNLLKFIEDHTYYLDIIDEKSKRKYKRKNFKEFCLSSQRFINLSNQLKQD